MLFVVEGGAFAAVVQDHVGEGEAGYGCCDDCRKMLWLAHACP